MKTRTEYIDDEGEVVDLTSSTYFVVILHCVARNEDTIIHTYTVEAQN